MSGRSYSCKPHSVLSHTSASSLRLFHSTPFANDEVLGWQPFKDTHGTRMSQRGHHGWGRLPSSKIIIVSRKFRCRKCTHRPVLIDSPPLHPSTGKSHDPTALGRKIGSPAGGLPLIYQDNDVMCLAVSRKQLRRQVRSAVWELH